MIKKTIQILLLLLSSLSFSLQAQIMRDHGPTRNTLNIELLSDSNKMKPYINGIVSEYAAQSTSHSLTSKVKATLDVLIDSSLRHEQITEILRTFVHALDTSSLSDAIPSIVAYFYGMDIEVGEPSVIADRLVTGVKIIGAPAPALKGVSAERMLKGKLVLIYHDSSCARCHASMRDLKQRYQMFEAKGYDIVSISADTNKEVFEKYVKELPWEYKLCDYKEYSGDNFLNYGVASVPLYILIDGDGIVVNTYHRLMDLAEEIRSK